QNEGSAGAMVGTGVGLGVGATIGQKFGETIETNTGFTESQKTASCPSCHTQVKEGQKFCHECGSSLKINCKQCNTELSSGDQFCPECGTKVNG
ncbi:MAG: zinc-ribbon domain-containing protein, partial [Erysipelothrix sp.]